MFQYTLYSPGMLHKTDTLVFRALNSLWTILVTNKMDVFWSTLFWPPSFFKV